MENQTSVTLVNEKLSFDRFREEVLSDYKIACISRETSLVARKEVLTGKAKFGILEMAKSWPRWPWQNFFKQGISAVATIATRHSCLPLVLLPSNNFSSQLFADPDINNDPFSAGRQMNSHFATPFVDEKGEWLDLANRKNISADIAPTAGQMPRALGLALASKSFRSVEVLKQFSDLSDNGNEVCFVTVGDASTSEGHFWETVNAAAVLQVPMAIFVWDDGYGISVPKKYQTAKSSISEHSWECKKKKVQMEFISML
jgi:hypothetical protein